MSTDLPGGGGNVPLHGRQDGSVKGPGVARPDIELDRFGITPLRLLSDPT